MSENPPRVISLGYSSLSEYSPTSSFVLSSITSSGSASIRRINSREADARGKSLAMLILNGAGIAEISPI